MFSYALHTVFAFVFIPKFVHTAHERRRHPIINSLADLPPFNMPSSAKVWASSERFVDMFSLLIGLRIFELDGSVRHGHWKPRFTGRMSSNSTVPISFVFDDVLTEQIQCGRFLGAWEVEQTLRFQQIGSVWLDSYDFIDVTAFKSP